jgi:hypothetical protein
MLAVTLLLLTQEGLQKQQGHLIQTPALVCFTMMPE